VKFLIDECLSPDLAMLARRQGYVESTHVSWLGMSGAKDHVVTSRAITDGFVFVTHNTVDFRSLYARQEVHVGLICFNTAAGMKSLELQKSLFLLALSELAGNEAWKEQLLRQFS
jgi:predicted nuclease of predicted toxin-antitoxin system